MAEDGKPGQRVRCRVDQSSPLPVYAACVFPHKNLMLEIGPIDSVLLPQGFIKPLVKGINLTLECHDQKLGSDVALLLELQQTEAQDIFTAFLTRVCDELDELDKPEDAVKAVLSLIKRWKDFFSGISEILSESRQTGLYGELYLLMRLAAENIDIGEVVRGWTGSRRTSQDFEFGSAAIEVKASAAVDPATVTITNVRQLDDKGLDVLFLARVLFDARQGVDNTLPKLICEIRKKIKDSASGVSLDFEEKLLLSGYFDKHEEQYSFRSYSEREIVFYDVKDGFPRLLEDDLPAGVTNASYEISLEACSAFIVSKDFFIDTVRKACD